MESTMDFDYC